MLRQRLRAGVDGLARPGPQLSDASDRRVVVEAVVNQEAADHRAGATRTTPAVDVNDSATGYLASDSSEDPVVARVVDHAVVGNGMGEVPDVPSGLLGGTQQCLSVRIEEVMRRRQIDDRVDSRLDTIESTR